MNEQVCVGIDFSGLEVKVVYVTDHQAVQLSLSPDITEPSVLFSRDETVDELDFSFGVQNLARFRGNDD